jgi:CRISPR-associated protein Cmr1
MIRRLSHRWDPEHAPSHPLANLYPRAAFGLPIVFHFQSKKDPEQVILEPQDEDYDRMASPLLLRPYRAGDGRYHPAALLIPGWEQALATQLRFKDNPAHQMLETWPGNPERRTEAAAEIRPMAEHSTATDPLSAFLAFFAKEVL